MSNLDKLRSLSEGRTSPFEAEAEYRSENRDWLAMSAKFAFALLRELRFRGMTQKELADKMGVSGQYVNKIVKGRENLSFETVCKIQAAIGVDFLKIIQPMHVSDEIVSKYDEVLPDNSIHAA